MEEEGVRCLQWERQRRDNEEEGEGTKKVMARNVAFAHQEEQGDKKSSVSKREVTFQRQGSRKLFPRRR